MDKTTKGLNEQYRPPYTAQGGVVAYQRVDGKGPLSNTSPYPIISSSPFLGGLRIFFPSLKSNVKIGKEKR